MQIQFMWYIIYWQSYTIYILYLCLGLYRKTKQNIIYIQKQERLKNKFSKTFIRICEH